MFCGTRILTYGGHSLRCSQLHQRRIFSLLVTTLPRVTTGKPGCFDTNVNKLDLSAVGILSSTATTLFSTEAMTGDDSPEVKGEVGDTEGSMEPQDKGPSTGFRWPTSAPIRKLQPYQAPHRVRNRVYVNVSNCSFLDDNILKDALSQFGEISHVSTFRSKCKTYYYGFVSFVRMDDMNNALKADSFQGSDGEVFRIERIGQGTGMDQRERKHCFFVRGFSNDMSIAHLSDHFQSFGKLSVINLFLRELISSVSDDGSKKKNYAVISYEQVDTEKLLETEHCIDSENILVEESMNPKYGLYRDRCLRVHISGIDLKTTNESQISEYFSGFGVLEEVKLYDDGHGMVVFNNKEDAMAVAKLCLHTLNTSTIKARLLGGVFD